MASWPICDDLLLPSVIPLDHSGFSPELESVLQQRQQLLQSGVCVRRLELVPHPLRKSNEMVTRVGHQALLQLRQIHLLALQRREDERDASVMRSLIARRGGNAFAEPGARRVLVELLRRRPFIEARHLELVKLLAEAIFIFLCFGLDRAAVVYLQLFCQITPPSLRWRWRSEEFSRAIQLEVTCTWTYLADFSLLPERQPTDRYDP